MEVHDYSIDLDDIENYIDLADIYDVERIKKMIDEKLNLKNKQDEISILVPSLMAEIELEEILEPYRKKYNV